MPIGSSKIGVLGAGLVPGGTETFNAPGTFSIPPGVKKVSVTGKGATGNPGNAGAAGTPGNAGSGGAGGGAGYGNNPGGANWARGGSAFNPGPLNIPGPGIPCPFQSPTPFTPRFVLGGFHQIGPVNNIPSDWPGCARIPTQNVFTRISQSGQQGQSGNAGTAGTAGNPGNSGQDSLALCNTFPGGAGGNAGNPGNAGNGGTGGQGGGGGTLTVCDATAPGGSAGNGAGSGLCSKRVRSPQPGPTFTTYQYIAGRGGGGAGTVNSGNPAFYIPCTDNQPTSSSRMASGVGGADPSLPCLANFCSIGNLVPNFYPGKCPAVPSIDFLNTNTTLFPRKMVGGNGGGQGGVLYALNPGPVRECGSVGCTTLVPRINAPAPVMAPAFRAGGGGGFANTPGATPQNFRGPQTPGPLPFCCGGQNFAQLPRCSKYHGGGGGGGGRGNAGNAGTASPTPSGVVATPVTFNCVPVTPGGTAPITVASPGGQIVISWNPQ
jgi:hypothetical protein